MVVVKIQDMREIPRMRTPGFTETMVRISYRTEKGYMGVVEIPKSIATEEKIEEEIKKSVTDIAELVGTEILVE